MNGPTPARPRAVSAAPHPPAGRDARRIGAAIAALALLPATAGAQPAPPPALAAAVAAYDRATVANDTVALAAIVADDYLLVNSDASVQRKASYLADFRVPGFRVEPYRLGEPFYRPHGDTALVGGLLPLNWTQDGVRQSRRLRVVHQWVRSDGRWRLSYTQLTRVPDLP